MGNMAYKARHKVLGLCRSCSEKAAIGDFCAIHYYSNLQSNRTFYDRNFTRRNDLKQQRRVKYKNEGRCTDCGIKLLEDEGVRCINCKSNAVRRV